MEAILRKEITIDRVWRRAIAVGICVLLTALGAFIRIPLPFVPVPLTLQTFFVLLSAALLGARLGCSVQIIYICIGAAGLPIFTGAGAGLLYITGPSAGYLLGFVLAAMIIGTFIKYCRDNPPAVFLLLSLADLALLCCGALWIKFLFGLSLAKALYIGVLTFLPLDLVKALAATFIYLKLKPVKKALQ